MKISLQHLQLKLFIAIIIPLFSIRGMEKIHTAMLPLAEPQESATKATPKNIWLKTADNKVIGIPLALVSISPLIKSAYSANIQNNNHFDSIKNPLNIPINNEYIMRALREMMSLYSENNIALLCTDFRNDHINDMAKKIESLHSLAIKELEELAFPFFIEKLKESKKKFLSIGTYIKDFTLPDEVLTRLTELILSKEVQSVFLANRFDSLNFNQAILSLKANNCHVLANYEKNVGLAHIKKPELCIDTLLPQDMPVKDMAFCSNAVIAVRNSTCVTLINLITGSCKQTPLDAVPLSMATSPDGSLLAIASADKTRIYNINQLERYKDYTDGKSKEAKPTHVCFTSDNRFLIEARADKVLIWDIKQGTKKDDTEDKMIHNDEIIKLQLDKNNSSLVTVSKDGTVSKWNLAGALLNKPVKLNKDDLSLCINSTNTRLVLGSSSTSAARLFDIDSGRYLQDISCSEKAKEAVFHPEDRKIVLLNNKGVDIWDIETNTLLEPLVCTLGTPQCCTFDPTGNCLIVGYKNGARVWNCFDSSLADFIRSKLPIEQAFTIALIVEALKKDPTLYLKERLAKIPLNPIKDSLLKALLIDDILDQPLDTDSKLATALNFLLAPHDKAQPLIQRPPRSDDAPYDLMKQANYTLSQLHPIVETAITLWKKQSNQVLLKPLTIAHYKHNSDAKIDDQAVRIGLFIHFLQHHNTKDIEIKKPEELIRIFHEQTKVFKLTAKQIEQIAKDSLRYGSLAKPEKCDSIDLYCSLNHNYKVIEKPMKKTYIIKGVKMDIEDNMPEGIDYIPNSDGRYVAIIRALFDDHDQNDLNHSFLRRLAEKYPFSAYIMRRIAGEYIKSGKKADSASNDEAAWLEAAVKVTGCRSMLENLQSFLLDFYTFRNREHETEL